MPEFSYDPKCEELARYFLPHCPEREVAELAQAIQEAIENHMGENDQ